MNDNIANPSIIFAGFGRFDKRFEQFKEDGEKLGLRFREVKLFDIQIPINNRYDEAVNFLKHNINPILRHYLTSNFPFRDTIFRQIENKTQLKEFNYKDFDKHFVQSNLYKYGFLGLTPLFVDKKYLDVGRKVNFTDEEMENYYNLFSLRSNGFKPLLTPTKEEKDFKKLE